MKIPIAMIAALHTGLALGWAAETARSPEAMLEAAIYQAKVLGNLPAAIQQFESIAAHYAGRPVAAQALSEMGQAEQQLGHVDRAREIYLRLVTEYPDQRQWAAQLWESLDTGLPPAATAESGTYSNIKEYPLPASGATPEWIVAGPDQALWFTEVNAGKIGRITTAGVLSEYRIPTAGSQPGGIAKGRDDALWFTESAANKIGRIAANGVITEYVLPTPASSPKSITTGADGALWFTERSKIGRITTAGAVTEFPLAAPNPYAIVAGPDGALWFTHPGINQIGRITTAGAVAEYAVPTAHSGVNGIVWGPDAALWFTESAANRIGRITTAGDVTEFPLPASNGAPYAIASGRDRALWFTERHGQKIGRITTTGVITEFPVLDNGQPTGITAGQDGALWFAESSSNRIASAPACSLGYSATFAHGTLTQNFNLGIVTPATFSIEARNATRPVGKPFSKWIGPAIPPKAFTLHRTTIPNMGKMRLKASLSDSAGQPICAEWTTVNTAR